MTDAAAIVLAACTAVGALVARPLPAALPIAIVVLAFLVRRPALLCAGGALLASALAATAWAGLKPPRPATVTTTATLLSDPDERGGAVRAAARVGRRHVEVSARGANGRVLSTLLAGARRRVGGRIGPGAPV